MHYHEHTFDGKSLIVVTTDFTGTEAPDRVQQVVADEFQALAPYMKNGSQMLVIRDIPEYAMEGEETGGSCFNQHEAYLAVKNWDITDQDLRPTVGHELHHMARWQNNGYGSTLGGALLSEGLGVLYELVVSGVEPSYSKDAASNITATAARAALTAWELPDEPSNHNEWFFEGPHGKWVGYNLGILLAKRLFDADNFDLERSVMIVAEEAKPAFEEVVIALEANQAGA